jgi:heat shock protein HslJ
VTLRRSPSLLTLVALVLVACADTGDASGTGNSTRPGDLIGVVWTLDRSSMADLVGEVPLDAAITITFEDGQASGRAACNSYGGAYDADDGGSLSFEGFAVTEMACDPELMALESAYLQKLADVTGFGIEGVMWLSGEGFSLTFGEEAATLALPLVGTTWTLTTIASGDAVSSVLIGTEVTAEFTADGTVAGSAGCNRYSGTYRSTGDQLTFYSLASTKMACADDVMSQEGAFLVSMGEVATFAIEGEQLTVSDGSGALLLGFDGTAA